MTTRWSYRDPALLWLLAIAYVLHVAEEWLAGFPRWVAAIVSQPMPDAVFFMINGVVLLLMIGGIRAATRQESRGSIAVAIATIALVNTVVHVGGSILTGGYAPGMLSAVVFYAPLGTLTIIRAIDQAPRTQIVRGIVTGLLLHAALFPIVLVALALARN
jgi:hypothetical protein